MFLVSEGHTYLGMRVPPHPCDFSLSFCSEMQNGGGGRSRTCNHEATTLASTGIFSQPKADSIHWVLHSASCHDKTQFRNRILSTQGRISDMCSCKLFLKESSQLSELSLFFFWLLLFIQIFFPGSQRCPCVHIPSGPIFGCFCKDPYLKSLTSKFSFYLCAVFD